MYAKTKTTISCHKWPLEILKALLILSCLGARPSSLRRKAFFEQLACGLRCQNSADVAPIPTGWLDENRGVNRWSRFNTHG